MTINFFYRDLQCVWWSLLLDCCSQTPAIPMSSFLEMAMEFINSATQVLRRQESTYEKVFDGGREIEISSDSGKISDSASDHYVQTRNARWISYRAKAISLHLSFLSVYLVIAVVVALIFQSSFNRNASLIHCKNYLPSLHSVLIFSSRNEYIEDQTAYIQWNWLVLRQSTESGERRALEKFDFRFAQLRSCRRTRKILIDDREFCKIVSGRPEESWPRERCSLPRRWFWHRAHQRSSRGPLRGKF